MWNPFPPMRASFWSRWTSRMWTSLSKGSLLPLPSSREPRAPIPAPPWERPPKSTTILRLLFARIGKPHCPKCGMEIAPQTTPAIVDRILAAGRDQDPDPGAPCGGKERRALQLLQKLSKDGFTSAKIDGEARLLEESILLEKNKKHTISVIVDRLVVNQEIRRRLTDSMELTLSLSEGQALMEEFRRRREIFFSQQAACRKCGISVAELTPQMFSFNNPQGACPECSGLGTKRYFDPDLIVPNPGLSVPGRGTCPLGDPPIRLLSADARRHLPALPCGHLHSFKNLPKKARRSSSTAPAKKRSSSI
jgi:excinuclease UvrABC ATPase subunit